MSSFWQFFNRQMAIFRRVRSELANSNYELTSDTDDHLATDDLTHHIPRCTEITATVTRTTRQYPQCRVSRSSSLVFHRVCGLPHVTHTSLSPGQGRDLWVSVYGTGQFNGSTQTSFDWAGVYCDDWFVWKQED